MFIVCDGKSCVSEPICVSWARTLHWRHNDYDGVSNHQPHGCLLNRLFRRKSKKTSKLRVTGLCAGNSSVAGEFPAHKGPVTRKMFPFDDVIMVCDVDKHPYKQWQGNILQNRKSVQCQTQWWSDLWTHGWHFVCHPWQTKISISPEPVSQTMNWKVSHSRNLALEHSACNQRVFGLSHIRSVLFFTS